MNLEQIKAAVRSGNFVYWSNRAYQVKVFILPNGEESWVIHCNLNNYQIGLTWLDGVTMNGKESDFFIDNSHVNVMTE